MLGGSYLGQTYLGQDTSELVLQRGTAPVVRFLQTTSRYSSEIYDEVSAYDSSDTYDGEEIVQLSEGDENMVKDISLASPLVRRLHPTYRYSSEIYDEISAYDSFDSYDGEEMVQSSSGHDILVNIPRSRA